MGRRPLVPPDTRPAELVRSVLAHDRRLGESFDVAWGDALETLDGLDAQERRAWLDALADTRHAWADAYGSTGNHFPLDSTALL